MIKQRFSPRPCGQRAPGDEPPTTCRRTPTRGARASTTHTRGNRRAPTPSRGLRTSRRRRPAAVHDAHSPRNTATGERGARPAVSRNRRREAASLFQDMRGSFVPRAGGWRGCSCSRVVGPASVGGRSSRGRPADRSVVGSAFVRSGRCVDKLPGGVMSFALSGWGRCAAQWRASPLRSLSANPDRLWISAEGYEARASLAL